MSRPGNPRTGSTPRRVHAEPTRRSADAASWLLLAIVLAVVVAVIWSGGWR